MRWFAVILVVVLVGVAAGVSQAAAPVQLKNIDISNSFTIPRLCPFGDVTVTVSGTANVTLWLNKAGLVVREHDTTPGSTVTFSGNGKSFSFPNALTIWTDYGSGATLGGSATLKLSGLFGHAPGISSDAGQQVIADTTIVDFFTVNGVDIPINEGGVVETEHGHFHSGEAFDAATCAALS
jgi:hypothetical protein